MFALLLSLGIFVLGFAGAFAGRGVYRAANELAGRKKDADSSEKQKLDKTKERKKEAKKNLNKEVEPQVEPRDAVIESKPEVNPELSNQNEEVELEAQEQLTKEEVKRMLTEYKSMISSKTDPDGISFNQILKDKLDSKGVADVGARECALFAASNLWEKEVSKAVAKVETLEDKLETTEDLQSIVDAIPGLSFDWFDSKPCEYVLDSTVNKFHTYKKELGVFDEFYRSYLENGREEDNFEKESIFETMKLIIKEITNVQTTADKFERMVLRERIHLYQMGEAAGLKDSFKNLSEKVVGIEKTLKTQEDLVAMSNEELKEMRLQLYEVLSKSKSHDAQLLGLWTSLGKEIASRSKDSEEIKTYIIKSLNIVKKEIERKADANTVNQELRNVNAILEEQGKALQINTEELKEMRLQVYELVKTSDMHNKQLLGLWTSLGKEIVNRSRETQDLKKDIAMSLSVVKRALSKKADAQFVASEIKSINDNITKKLSDIDLMKLSQDVEKLNKAFNNVKDEALKIVQAETDKLKEKIREFAARSIGTRIGQQFKKLEEKNDKSIEAKFDKLDEATSQMIADKVFSELSTYKDTITREVIDSVVNQTVFEFAFQAKASVGMLDTNKTKRLK